MAKRWTETQIKSGKDDQGRKWFESEMASDIGRYLVRVCPKHYIEVRGLCSLRKSEFKRFAIGDHAEYDSYNLAYTGPVLSIGARTVTIAASGS
jgi:hypothetical protein